MFQHSGFHVHSLPDKHSLFLLHHILLLLLLPVLSTFKALNRILFLFSLNLILPLISVLGTTRPLIHYITFHPLLLLPSLPPPNSTYWQPPTHTFSFSSSSPVYPKPPQLTIVLGIHLIFSFLMLALLSSSHILR